MLLPDDVAELEHWLHISSFVSASELNLIVLLLHYYYYYYYYYYLITDSSFSASDRRQRPGVSHC